MPTPISSDPLLSLIFCHYLCLSVIPTPSWWDLSFKPFLFFFTAIRVSTPLRCSFISPPLHLASTHFQSEDFYIGCTLFFSTLPSAKQRQRFSWSTAVKVTCTHGVLQAAQECYDCRHFLFPFRCYVLHLDSDDSWQSNRVFHNEHLKTYIYLGGGPVSTTEKNKCCFFVDFGCFYSNSFTSRWFLKGASNTAMNNQKKMALEFQKKMLTLIE